MRRLLVVAAGLIVAALLGIYLLWWAPGPKPEPQTVIIQEGATISSVARKLEKQGAIPGTAKTYYVMARLFGQQTRTQIRDTQATLSSANKTCLATIPASSSHPFTVERQENAEAKAITTRP